jgi:hypothetical protein
MSLAPNQLTTTLSPLRWEMISQPVTSEIGEQGCGSEFRFVGVSSQRAGSEVSVHR